MCTCFSQPTVCIHPPCITYMGIPHTESILAYASTHARPPSLQKKLLSSPHYYQSSLRPQISISMEGASLVDDISSHELRDRYRSHMYGEGEKDTVWRFGAPPRYDAVNKLFEQGRTQEWPEGSLEETVQNAVKTWEMELSHKPRLQDFKTVNPAKFRFLVNGRKGLTGEETLKMGSYNALLQSSLPEELQCYRAGGETFESSHEVFHTAFPRGFAWEVMKVYTGPPEIAFKFRHWGFMDGPYNGHAPTGEMVEFTGLAVLKVDNGLMAEDVEIYYDPGELFGGLLRGPLLRLTPSDHEAGAAASSLDACPFFNKK